MPSKDIFTWHPPFQGYKFPKPIASNPPYHWKNGTPAAAEACSLSNAVSPSPE